MKKILYIFTFVFLGISCTDLDLPPKNILFDEDLYNQEGIEAYMAGMYRMLPMNDFKVSNDGMGYFNWNCIVWTTMGTGEGLNFNQMGGMTTHKTEYWTEGYKIIRNANRMINNLPAYVGQIPGAEEWIAECKFIRAYVYFTLVSRYGGVPILDEVQDFDPTFESLMIARNSNEECYDFILKDLDDAIAGMKEGTDRSRANKNVALAFKSKAALFAGSIAKYGEEYIYMSKNDPNLMLCGIPRNRAASYYQQAWEAAKALEGKFILMGLDASNNQEKEDAYANIFAQAKTNGEAIFTRNFDYSTYSHSFDVVMSPSRHVGTYGNRYMLTLDWMELFDGPNLDADGDGKLDVTYIGEDGKEYYKVFNSAAELYEGAEPRLRATILVPLNEYRGAKTDFRAGIIREDWSAANPIEKVYPDDYEQGGEYNKDRWPFFGDGSGKGDSHIFRTTRNRLQQRDEDLYVRPSDGEKIPSLGYEGPAIYSQNDGTVTGIWGRKWLDMSLSKSSLGAVHTSSSTWIDLRYGEVVLNRAEAAIEMFQDGHTISGVDLQEDAFECINMIRKRAGANLLASKSELSTEPAFDRRRNPSTPAVNPGKGGFVFAPNRGIQIVRVERYKELTYEHKIYWDLRRWFSFHEQIRQYKIRSIIPFMFAEGAAATTDPQGFTIYDGKYIFDIRGGRADRRTFNPNGGGSQNYFEKIPGGEMRKNPLLEGNVNQ